MIDSSTLSIRRFKRDEYDRLVEIGLFADERIELLDGLLVEMSPQGAAHAYAVRQLTMLLARAIGDRALLQIQSPLAVNGDSEPEPDVALVPRQDYSREHPKRALLVVEVADDSIRKDRLIKARLYALAGVPEYWIVNLRKRAVEVLRSPSSDGYLQVAALASGDVVSPQAFPDLVLAVDEILPATS